MSLNRHVLAASRSCRGVLAASAVLFMSVAPAAAQRAESAPNTPCYRTCLRGNTDICSQHVFEFRWSGSPGPGREDIAIEISNQSQVPVFLESATGHLPRLFRVNDSNPVWEEVDTSLPSDDPDLFGRQIEPSSSILIYLHWLEILEVNEGKEFVRLRNQELRPLNGSYRFGMRFVGEAQTVDATARRQIGIALSPEFDVNEPE